MMQRSRGGGEDEKNRVRVKDNVTGFGSENKRFNKPR